MNKRHHILMVIAYHESPNLIHVHLVESFIIIHQLLVPVMVLVQVVVGNIQSHTWEYECHVNVSIYIYIDQARY